MCIWLHKRAWNDDFFCFFMYCMKIEKENSGTFQLWRAEYLVGSFYDYISARAWNEDVFVCLIAWKKKIRHSSIVIVTCWLVRGIWLYGRMKWRCFCSVWEFIKKNRHSSTVTCWVFRGMFTWLYGRMEWRCFCSKKVPFFVRPRAHAEHRWAKIHESCHTFTWGMSHMCTFLYIIYASDVLYLCAQWVFEAINPLIIYACLLCIYIYIYKYI